jgi:hypothetical protein
MRDKVRHDEAQALEAEAEKWQNIIADKDVQLADKDIQLADKDTEIIALKKLLGIKT